ncbi:MAG: helical backbone metal receptor, partial [Planctomycetota bacterium]
MSAAVPPRRIVSLVPSTTETVCAFGARERLVGCTRYCTEPAAALRGVARIGGTKNPKRDAIAALRPDLVLANAEENRPDDLEWLAARAPVLVQTPRTVAEAAAALGELAARLACGEEVATRVASEVAATPRAAGRPLRARLLLAACALLPALTAVELLLHAAPGLLPEWFRRRYPPNGIELFTPGVLDRIPVTE